MAALTGPIDRMVKHLNLKKTLNVNVPASTTIYKGALISINASGQAVNATGALLFGGIAAETKITGASATTNRKFTIERNLTIQVPLDVATAESDIGKKVYVGADNNTVTKTPSASLAAKVGRITAIVSASVVEVDTEAAGWFDEV